jgi:hypothetical protein
MTLKQATMALTGTPKEPPSLGEDTTISLRLLATILALVLTFTGIVWAFHSNAISTIKTNQSEVLKGYPTFQDLQKARDDDRRFFTEEFRSLREDIRRTK